ncbi:Ig-like domain-containing protein [Parageobacillus toebii]|uniref:BIG2 domain-containing protein n=1 Tax=Parageobacillus toebii TaxID=153151 RepID=A0A150N3A9_9BACL|nr:Ig-like domain-containing protein [Parageobacillus toebii]KYD31175.1 hypothetical protein B4110_3686 [Parageobacillus toebii]
MKRIWIGLLALGLILNTLFPSIGLAQTTTNNEVETNTTKEPAITITPGTAQIKIEKTGSNDNGSNDPNEIYIQSDRYDHYVRVGEEFSLLDHLKIVRADGTKVDPQSIINDLNIEVEDPSIIQVDRLSFTITGTQLGQSSVHISYQNTDIFLLFHVVDQLEKTYTIKYPSSDDEYSRSDIYVMGYQEENHRYFDSLYYEKDRKSGELTFSIPASELQYYQKFKAVLVTDNAMYIVDLEDDSNIDVSLDDSYSKLSFPNTSEFQMMNVSVKPNMNVFPPINIFLHDNTFYLPKGDYAISSTYKKNGKFYVYANQSFSISENQHTITFSDENLVPFTISYQNNFDYLTLDLGKDVSLLGLPASASNVEVYAPRGTYDIALNGKVDNYHIGMFKSGVSIESGTNISIDTQFQTVINLKDTYEAGQFIHFNPETLQYKNQQGFILDHIYNSENGKPVKPVLTLTNVDDPTESYTYTLDSLQYPSIKLPITSGTFNVTITMPLDSDTSGEEPTLVSLSTDPEDIHLLVNESQELKVFANYSDGSSKDVTQSATYISADPNIATVTADGTVKALAPGSTTITVSYKEKSISVPVTIDNSDDEGSLSQISVNQSEFQLDINETADLQVMAHYTNGTAIDITNEAEYESSNPDVAIVEERKIKAVSAGTAIITVKYQGRTAEIRVVVNEPPRQLEKISFNQQAYEVTHLDSTAFHLTAIYDDGESEDITSNASYTVSDESIVVIENGRLKGLKPGTATVTASYNGKSVSITVTVKPYLLKLESSKKQIEVEKDKSFQLSVNAVYSDGSKKDVTQDASYRVEDGQIATVSENALLVGKKEGTTTVTAEYGGKQYVFEVTVVSGETGFELSIKDSETKVAIGNAMVKIQKYEQSDMTTINEKQAGFYKEEVEPGLYNIFIYKKGYLPVKEQVLVKDKNIAKVEVLLQKSELIRANFTATKMNLEDLREVGIDPNDPANRWVYKFKAQLDFQGKNIDITYYGNSKGTLYGNDRWDLGGGYYLYPFLIPVGHEEDENSIPMVAYMIVPGEVSWLKEFFKAQLTIQNLAPKEFKLQNAVVKLELPDGLSLANTFEPQTLEVNIGEIPGEESFHQEWYIRGDKKGEYNLKATFTSTLYPFDEPVNAEFVTKQPIKVWGDDALKMNIKAEKTAKAGMPYAVHVEIQNVSDAPVYYLNLELKEEGKKNFFYSPNTKLSHFVEELKAGETLTLKYLLIPRISGTLDLSDSFILKTGGNANIETTISTLE